MGDELEAMQGVRDALDELDENETGRVLQWAVAKYGGWKVPKGTVLGGDGGNDEDEDNDADHATPTTYERISDLFEAASPSTIVDYALVAGYWFQVVKGQDEFTGRGVNSELKDQGQGSKNITDTLTSLIKRKPSAVRQTKKGGSSKQAQKRYRLTTEGIKTVDRMIAGTAG